MRCSGFERFCLRGGACTELGRRSRHDGRRAESKENAHQQHDRNRYGSRIPQPLSRGTGESMAAYCPGGHALAAAPFANSFSVSSK